ncbi:DapH/DapD/GlmU-related protein [Candidatus Omnitrophota bacterium]
MRKFIIFGVSDFLSDIFDLIHAHNGTVVKIFQNIETPSKERSLPIEKRIELLGYNVELHKELDAFQPEEGYEYVLGCTTVEKYRLVEELKKKHGITFSALIHPKAHLGSGVYVGEGVVVSPGVVVAPGAHLDDFCVINRMVSIGHNVRIGQHSRIGPSSAIAGSTRIGERCSIGMSVSIIDHVYIGDDTVIGAGALVTKDLPENVIAYGAPAKVKRNNE